MTYNVFGWTLSLTQSINQLTSQCCVSEAVICMMRADYKPVFANIPKAPDDSRSSRQSNDDQYKSMSKPSYERYYDSPWPSMPPPPRRDGITCITSAVSC